jgi:hypothetical protein
MTDFLTRLLLYAAIAAALMGMGAVGASKYYAPRLEAEKRAFAEFRGGVEALGRAASLKAKETDEANRKRKVSADDENRRSTSKLLADNKRLRDDRDRARGNIVPSAPADSRNPDLACFSRPEFESAVGGLIGSLRGIAQEGDQSALDLRLSREWAVGR